MLSFLHILTLQYICRPIENYAKSVYIVHNTYMRIVKKYVYKS